MAFTKQEDARVAKLEDAIKNLTADLVVDFAVSTNIALTQVLAGFEITETILDNNTVANNGQLYLLWSQTNKAENGVYIPVSINPVVLKRYSLFSTYQQIQGKLGIGSRVQKKETNDFYFGTTTEPFTLGTTDIDFTFAITPPVLLEENFTKTFAVLDWVANGSKYEITIPQGEHNKIASTIGGIVIKQIIGNEAIIIEIDDKIVNNLNGEVKLICNEPFDGFAKFTGSGTNVTAGIPNASPSTTGGLVTNQDQAFGGSKTFVAPFLIQNPNIPGAWIRISTNPTDASKMVVEYTVDNGGTYNPATLVV